MEEREGAVRLEENLQCFYSEAEDLKLEIHERNYLMRIRKNISKEILCTVIVMLIPLIVMISAYGLWHRDWNVPLNAAGDATGFLIDCANYIKGESRINSKTYALPIGVRNSFTLFEAVIPNFMMKIISCFVNESGMVMNLYYICTYPLTAIVMYFVLRRLEYHYIISMSLGIVYALLPGHWLRGVEHYAVGSSFFLPLICIVSIKLIEGSFCKEEWKNEKINVKNFWLSLEKKEFVCAIVFIYLITGCTLYYGFFSAFIIFFSALLGAASCARARELLYGGLLLVFDGIGLFICGIFPEILSKFLGSNAVTDIASTRVISDIEFYGMKIIQLLLPVPGHNNSVFANIRNWYDSNFLHFQNENAKSTLGLIMSIGFVVSILAVFFYKEQNRIVQIGKLNLFLICVATIGGLADIVGVITASFRTYNRMSFFIAAFSILCIAELFRQVDKRFLVKVFLSFFILVTAIYDQIPADMKEDDEQYCTKADAWYEDKNFFDKIEEFEGAGAKILQMPYAYSDEFQQTVIEDTYPVNLPNCHVNGLQWSVGAPEYSENDLWLKHISRFSMEPRMRIAAAADFAGIALYKAGYTEDKYQEVLSELDRILGAPVVVHSNDTWIYYSLRNYKQKLVNTFGTDYLQAISENIIKNILDYDDNFYSIGNEIEFIYGKTDHLSYVSSGFSFFETDGCWIEDENAELSFSLAGKIQNDIKLSVNYVAVFTYNELKVYANDTLIAQGIPERGTVTYDIPKELLDQDRLVIRFSMKDLQTPDTEDKRTLAVKIDKVKIENKEMQSVNELTEFHDDILNYIYKELQP